MDDKLENILKLKLNYVNFIKKNQKKISIKKKDEFRISTYNIHYFTDIYEKKSKFKEIIKNILKINSDIIILQEIIIGTDEVIINNNLKLNIRNFYSLISSLYNKTIFCNSVPSWFNAIYGNMVLINKNINYNVNESNYTFSKAICNVRVSGSHDCSPETRCYIYLMVKFKIYNLHIYGTHLDISDEKIRINQIKYIINKTKNHKNKNDIVFICGDFNTIDRSQYNSDDYRINNSYTKKNGKVIKYLKKTNFYDCHETNKSDMTTWNNTRVDFIFVNKKCLNYRAEYYFVDSSDHIPVIITLEDNFSIE